MKSYTVETERTNMTADYETFTNEGNARKWFDNMVKRAASDKSIEWVRIIHGNDFTAEWYR